jgi:lactonase
MAPQAQGRRGWLSLAAGLALGLPAVARAQESGGSPVPVPTAESALPTTIAGQLIAVPGAAQDLEGAVFDRDGRLLFSDVQGRRVLRLNEGNRIAEVAKLDRLMPAGLALARDGRVFIAAANGRGGGAVLAMQPDGTGLRTVVPESAGLFPNDLVLDAAGGLYVTDCRGTVGDSSGGVWYVPQDGAAPVPVVRNLAVANGVALSPEGRRLWVGEFALGRLYRLDLVGATPPWPPSARSRPITSVAPRRIPCGSTRTAASTSRSTARAGS